MTLLLYDKPAQLATGMIDVFVNGKLILKKANRPMQHRDDL